MIKKIQLSILPVIIIITILIMVFGVSMITMSKRLSSLSTQVTSEQRISAALNDSVRYYFNTNNELVAEKLSLQGKYKEVTDKNNKLTESQKILMDYVKEINKKYSLIVAANIQLQVVIDSLKGRIGVYDSIRHELSFNDSTKYLKYDMTVTNVLKYKDYDSKLYINSLILPNNQKISFNWDRSRVGYPVSFSITNSNEYFKVVDLDSYVIPELNKSKLKPTGWQKIGNFFGTSGEKIAVFGFGLGLGALGVFLLVQ